MKLVRRISDQSEIPQIANFKKYTGEFLFAERSQKEDY